MFLQPLSLNSACCYALVSVITVGQVSRCTDGDTLTHDEEYDATFSDQSSVDTIVVE